MRSWLNTRKKIRRPRIIKKRSDKVGLPPGTPIFIGRKKTYEVELSILEYDEGKAEEWQVKGDQELPQIETKSTTSWINLNGLNDSDVIEKLGTTFKLHPLLVEDVLNTDQRPKFDDYGSHIYIVLKFVEYDETKDSVIIDQISLILGKNYVVSFQEKASNAFNLIRERIHGKKGRIRSLGADYLFYTLIDVIVDHYFLVLEQISDKIEFLEDEVVSSPEITTLQTIHQLKTNLIFLRKTIWPLREVVNRLERSGSNLISPERDRYIRDIYDHVLQLIDTVETLRDIISGLLDIYLSSISNRMNEVMKVLTIIATILIPMTVISGIYGMNFQNIPELTWPLGYPVALMLMASIAIIMCIYFWRKGWL